MSRRALASKLLSRATMKTLRALALNLIVLTACAADGDGDDGTGGGRGPDAGAAGADASVRRCPSSEPTCVHGCGSDWLEDAVCVAGEWTCPDDTVNVDDCPPGTCWGPPLPGEVCGDDGWECRPDEAAYAACPELLCATCNGAFERGPIAADGCACSCAGRSPDSGVTCVRMTP
jgi:hypothetical protein